MAFTKWNFNYTPPPTLQEASGTSPASAVGSGAGIPPDGSRAPQLIKKLQNFRDTAAYLENVVDSVAKRVSVPIDVKENPELEAAFRRLYGSESAPGVITYGVYKSLVGTEDNITRTEIELSTMREQGEATRRWGISEIQKQDVRTLLDAYENGCIEGISFAPNFSLLYRELKNDQIILDTSIDALRIYTSVPKDGSGTSKTAGDALIEVKTQADNRNRFDVFSAGQGTTNSTGNGSGVIQPLTEFTLSGGAKSSSVSPELNTDPAKTEASSDTPPTDIPAEFWDPYNQTIDAFGSRYGAVYDIGRGIDCIYQDIANLIEALIANPKETILSILATLKMLKAMFHKKTLKDLRNAIAVVILPLLIGMAMRQLSFLDGVIQKALDPLRNRLNSLYRKMADISRLAERLSVPTGVSVPCNRHDLTGAIKQAMLRGAVRQAGNWIQLSNVDRLSKGLNVARDTLNWAVEMPMRSRAEAQRQILKMIDKRTYSTGSRLETLSSLRSVDSLISVCNGVLQEMQLANNTQNVATNATRQAAGSAQAAVDLPRLISNIQAPADVTLRTVSPQSTDTTQVSGDLLEPQLEVLAELDPIPAAPENVQDVLLSAGSYNLDLPDSATVPFFQNAELTQ